MSQRPSIPSGSPTVRVRLLPVGRTLEVPRGRSLQDLLFEHGVEFPCGGRGRCKGCRVQVSQGKVPVHAEEAELLCPEELAEGWRLACRIQANEDLAVTLAEWEAPILTDGSNIPFTPRQGLGVAVDLGTTTVVAQLLDLSTGHVLAVRSAMNTQGPHGADIMSRLESAIHGGAEFLTRLVRRQIHGLIRELCRDATVEAEGLKHVVLVGNTVMHHLFCGIDPAPLAAHPFVTYQDGMKVFRPEELGWEAEPGSGERSTALHGGLSVRFLPCLGGFVGSDLLAGLLATGLHERETPGALIDLGTNGELVLGNRDRLICASTAAGPAFEGARIEMGMRAATGAITEVQVRDGRLECHVLGLGEARGLCGSGLVDAVAAGLETKSIQPNGRLVDGRPFRICPTVHMTQCDVRELQLAKGAIAAGLVLLAQRWGVALDDLAQVYLAGAFGNYVNVGSARRIGLLPLRGEQIQPAGNTALRGAKLALFREPELDSLCQDLRDRIDHVSLHEDAEFQEAYAQAMHLGLGKL